MTTQAAQRKYNILTREARANPQAIYEQMRQQDPIWKTENSWGHPVWFFTRYEDALAILKDQRFGKNIRKGLSKEFADEHWGDENDGFAAVNHPLLNMDPPDHTRLRNLVHKAFTPRMVQNLRPRIQQIADDLLDAMAHKPQADLINDFAFPLPITVIAEMLGVHSEMRDKFRQWTQVLVLPDVEGNPQLAVMEFVQYINQLIEERRSEPKDDVLGALVNAREAGDKLDHMELLSMVFLLLVAGHETTVNLIGNGTLALLQHPEQMRKLQHDPTLIKSAIEEMLRYNGPVEVPTQRYAFTDVAYKGHQIKLGDQLLPSLLAANRDPAHFQNPNTFDITRTPNQHIAFGHGIHYCIGAPLARLEGAIAINTLLARCPNLRLNANVEDLHWNASLLLHGMKGLPVAYSA